MQPLHLKKVRGQVKSEGTPISVMMKLLMMMIVIVMKERF